MATIIELLHNMYNSTPQGFLGVSLIFGYMALILVIALVRIKQNASHH